MFANISEKITDRLVRKEVISACDWEIYQFGVEQFLTTVINTATAVAIGLVLGEFWQSLSLILVFMALRTYAGGYHASTPKKCYLLTSSIIIMALSAVKYIDINIFVCIGLLIMSGVVILVLSPVESENKPLDNIEFVMYRKRAIAIWVIEIICAVLCVTMGFLDILACITWAHIILALSQIVAKVEYEKI